MLASSFATITASGLHKSISREPGQAIRSQVAHTRRAAKFILYFIQLVLYAFGALENFALTIQTAVHGTSRAAHETAGATTQICRHTPASETLVILELNGGFACAAQSS